MHHTPLPVFLATVAVPLATPAPAWPTPLAVLTVPCARPCPACAVPCATPTPTVAVPLATPRIGPVCACADRAAAPASSSAARSDSDIRIIIELPHWSDGRPCLARREAAHAPSEANNWAQVRPSPRFGLNSRPRTGKSAARVSYGLFAAVDKRCTGL